MFLCRKCGEMADGDFDACPKCGDVPGAGRSAFDTWAPALGIAGVVLVVALVLNDGFASIWKPTKNAPTGYIFTNGDPPRVGLTRSEAMRSSWGTPTHESKTTSGNGETEFWHYDGGTLMLRDGVVVSVTERR